MPREEIKNEARKYFADYLDGLKGDTLTVLQTFEDGAMWAEKRTIEKATNFLKENLFEMESYSGDESVGTTWFSSVEDFVYFFKQYMNN